MVGNAKEQFHDQLLRATLIHPQVQAFLEGQLYTAQMESVSKEHMHEMPVLFSGLSGDLYLIDFKVGEEGLKVVTDNEEVKKIFSITYVSVS